MRLDPARKAAPARTAKAAGKRTLSLLTLLLLGLLSLSPALAADEDGDAAAKAPPAASAADTAEETESAGDGGETVLSVSAGTAVLMGAGLFTHIRGKLKEGKGEAEYVHFENHTRPYDPETGKFRNE